MDTGMFDRKSMLYEFGEFCVNAEQRTLARNGQEVALTPKVFDTLLLLVQNNGQIVEKPEMMKALWPDSFVEEANLSQNICVLRRALGDSPNGEVFIQTVPRRGYKFLPQVRLINAATTSNGNGSRPASANYWNLHSPFRGLQAFEPEDSWLFFGRDNDIQELCDRLYRAPVLVVVGNSGSGKSSLVRAGLIAALRRGRPAPEAAAIDSWRIALLRPSNSPFDYLAEVLPGALAESLDSRERAEFIADCRNKFPQDENALRNAICALCGGTIESSGRTRVLLVVDQFEEVFTSSWSQEMRARYINTLFSACRMNGPASTHLLLLLRADFYANCLEHPGLSRHLEANLYNVPRMSTEQLRESVEKRLALAEAQAEPALMDSLLADVGSEPGNLALLEHALSQLWKKCGGHGSTLTRESYLGIGGLRGSLSRHADEVYRDIGNDRQRNLVQRLFVELVNPGEGTHDTGRRVSKTDLLTLADREELEPLLTKLAASRLISVGREGDETFVEVAHETLIREWPALREWLSRNREEIHLERRLMQAAREWEGFDKEAGALLQGARLLQAEEWLTRHATPPALLAEFVRFSVQARDEKARKELEIRHLVLVQQQTQLKLEADRALAVAAVETRRATEHALAARRLRRRAIFLFAALICAAGAAIGAWVEWRESKENERLANDNAHVAQAARREAQIAELFARSKENEAQAARREIEAARAERNGNIQVARALHDEAERNRKMAAELRTAAEKQNQFKPEKPINDQEKAVINVKENDDALRQLQDEIEKNGRRTSEKPPSKKFSFETDPPSRPPVLAMEVPMPSGVEGAAKEVTGDDTLSRHLIAQAEQNIGKDSSLSVWLALHALKDARSAGARNAAEIILRRAAWKGRALPVIDLAANDRPISGMEFSPDNSRMITLEDGQPKKLSVWDIESGAQLAGIMADRGYWASAAFSPEGRFLALSSSDGTSRLWETKAWQPQPCKMHDDDTFYLTSVGANGRILISAGLNPLSQLTGTRSWVHVWNTDCSKSKPLILVPPFFGPVTAMALNEDATVLALSSATGDISLFQVEPDKVTPVEENMSGGLGAIHKILFARSSLPQTFRNASSLDPRPGFQP